MQTTKRQLLLTRTQWRKEGRGLRSKQAPCKTTIYQGREIELYAESQTKAFTPYKRALTYLVDLFGNYPDKIRYTTAQGETREIESENLYGPAWTYLERGFNYASCKKGIRIYNHLAQVFHVPAKEFTPFLVIDTDNHSPTLQSSEAHLELVKLLQDNMPDLMRAVGGRSSFVQYRGIEPTGLQLWIVLRRQQHNDCARKAARKFLLSLKPTGIEDRLIAANLPRLSQIEILPTLGKTVSMAGCYGKTVFTTKELKIVDQRFDCIGLYDHIVSDTIASSFYGRYRELVLVRQMESVSPCSSPALRPDLSQDTKSFWEYLVNIALTGVLDNADLHSKYLEPLAQQLLLREYFHHPDRDARTFQTLLTWVTTKHNGFVSRVLSGRTRNLEDQIRSTIKRVHKKTPQKIHDFYSSMRRKDNRFPHKIQYLEPLMLQGPECPQSLMSYCKGAVSPNQKKKKCSLSRRIPAISHLPDAVISKIANYALNTMRKGKKTERWTRFAMRVVAEIGENDNKSIGQERMMILAGRDPKKSSSFLKGWKNDLAKAGIIQKGWEGKIVRGVSNSRYSLTPWARQEINDTAPSKRSEGQAGSPGLDGGPNKMTAYG